MERVNRTVTDLRFQDDDDFDVRDIRIYSALFSNSSENSTSFGIDFPTKNLYL